MAKVIVIEDDEQLSQHIVDLLNFEKHTVDTSFDGDDAWERLQRYEYDLVILDWELPGLQGIEILKKFRAKGKEIPVLFLTGRSNISEKIEGFSAGADDYIPKPFDMRELQIRIKALLRRPQAMIKEVLSYRDLKLDKAQFKCLRGDEEIKLLPKEFAILEFLIHNKDLVFNADQLIDKIWTSEDEVSVDAIRQTIRRLRAKIDQAGEKSYITTIVGAGYKVESIKDTE